MVFLNALQALVSKSLYVQTYYTCGSESPPNLQAILSGISKILCVTAYSMNVAHVRSKKADAA